MGQRYSGLGAHSTAKSAGELEESLQTVRPSSQVLPSVGLMVQAGEREIDKGILICLRREELKVPNETSQIDAQTPPECSQQAQALTLHTELPANLWITSLLHKTSLLKITRYLKFKAISWKVRVVRRKRSRARRK